MTQLFESTLQATEIVVRQDENISDDNIIQNAGLWYPLVLVLEKVFHQNEVRSLSYEIGDDIIPRVSMVLSDDAKVNRESYFPQLDDTVTIFINNNQDEVHTPIHLDFLISDMDSQPDSDIMVIEGVQWIPELWIERNVSWNDSSFNILRQIAEDCGLGFVTNITDTPDVSLRICRHNYIEMIREIEKSAFVSDSDHLKIFIDQWNNLNVISVQTALNDRQNWNLLTNPATGESLDNVQIKISNNVFRDENHYDSNNDVTAIDWAPETNYGVGWLINNENVIFSEKTSENHLSSEVGETTIQNLNSLEGTGDRIFTNWVDTTYLHPKILSSKKQNDRNRKILSSGTFIKILLDYYTPDLFTYQHVNTEIFNRTKNEEIHSKDTSVSADELIVEGEDQLSYTYIPNENFTGSYIIWSMRFSYSSSNKKIMQSLRMKLVEPRPIAIEDS